MKQQYTTTLQLYKVEIKFFTKNYRNTNFLNLGFQVFFKLKKYLSVKRITIRHCQSVIDANKYPTINTAFVDRDVGEGATPFPGLSHFTFDMYLILLSIKQGGIKYHFLSLWYDATWD